MPQKILVIDDDPAVQEFLAKGLQRKGYDPLLALTGEDGLKLARTKAPDVVLLDINLPGMSGIEVCQALKRDPRTSSFPVLVITGNDREGQEVICLELGADDYLAKPFDMTMLLAHVHSLLRRGPYLGTQQNEIEKDGLRLQLQEKVVHLGGRRCDQLTPKEFDLLYQLVRNAATPLKREFLYQKVWGAAPVTPAVLRTVDVHVQRVRSKLGLDRKAGIVAVSGRGYMWSLPSPDE